jgi:YD repeat-containing protein
MSRRYGAGRSTASCGLTRTTTRTNICTNHDELTQTDPDGNVTSWGYTYTTTGTVTQLTDKTRTLPGGQQESFHYDSFGRLAHHYDFDGNSDWHTYISSGIHTGLEDHIDYYYPPTSYPYASTYFFYDNLNRVYEVENYPQVGSQTYTYYNYDENYNTTGGGAVNIDPSTGAKTAVSGDTDGLLTSVQGPKGTIHYIYDALRLQHLLDQPGRRHLRNRDHHQQAGRHHPQQLQVQLRRRQTEGEGRGNDDRSGRSRHVWRHLQPELRRLEQTDPGDLRLRWQQRRRLHGRFRVRSGREPGHAEQRPPQ